MYLNFTQTCKAIVTAIPCTVEEMFANACLERDSNQSRGFM